QMHPGSGKVSLIWGLIFGLVIGAIDIAYSAILNITNPPFLASLSQSLASLSPVVADVVYTFVASLPIYILLFVSFLLAGIFASRKTKKVSTGMLAGVLVGVLYLVLDLFIATILFYYVFTIPLFTQQGVPASVTRNLFITGVVYSLITELIFIGMGAGIGALGGLIGKGAGTPAQQYPFLAPNPYLPYPGQVHANPNQYPPYGQAAPGQMPPSPPG
ncbi:MAG: hypothetical protein ACRDHW_14200, partial [Ktedonobacteraceae bacterium]